MDFLVDRLLRRRPTRALNFFILLAAIPCIILAVDLLGEEAGGTAVIMRVSADPNGVAGNGVSLDSSISADGRYVAFTSEATNLVEDDTNGCSDIFRKDTITGEIMRVSEDPSGGQADDESYSPAISGDGRYVAFRSFATNLLPGQDLMGKIYLKDTATSAITLVSSTYDGKPMIDGDYPAISREGRYVVFQSTTVDPVRTDDYFWSKDIFVRDMDTGLITCVSADASGNRGDDPSTYPSISPDGRFVTFASEASNLIEGDTNGKQDILMKDTATGSVTLVSSGTAGGQGNDSSGLSSAISDDGRFVAFSSIATNLDPEDMNNEADVFVKDTHTGLLTMVSTDSAGNGGNSYSQFPSISGDGRYVAFWSVASNLVPDDSGVADDIFIKDVATGLTVRASIDFTAGETNGGNFTPSLSSDGKTVAFTSVATDIMPDNNFAADIFLAATSACSDPPKSLQYEAAYWSSFSEYSSRALSVDFKVEYAGEAAGHVAHIASSTATNGVVCTSPMPVILTLDSESPQGVLTLKYLVPPGVNAFKARIDALDGCGNSFAYPRPN